MQTSCKKELQKYESIKRQQYTWYDYEALIQKECELWGSINYHLRTCKFCARRNYESMKILKGNRIHDITRELSLKKSMSYEGQSTINPERANFVQEGNRDLQKY
jgi:hypothetical protein